MFVLMWKSDFLSLFKINGNFVAQVLNSKEATRLSVIGFCCDEKHVSPNLAELLPQFGSPPTSRGKRPAVLTVNALLCSAVGGEKEQNG